MRVEKARRDVIDSVTQNESSMEELNEGNIPVQRAEVIIEVASLQSINTAPPLELVAVHVVKLVKEIENTAASLVVCT